MTDLPRTWLGCATDAVEVDAEAMLTHRRRCACGADIAMVDLLVPCLVRIFAEGESQFGDPATFSGCTCGHVSAVYVWFGRGDCGDSVE